MASLPRILLRTTILLIAGAAFVIMLSLWAMHDFLAGEDFRKMIADNLGAKIGIDGKLKKVKWTDNTTARSEGFGGKGTGKTALRYMNSERIVATFDPEALRERVARISLLAVDRLLLDIAKPERESVAPDTVPLLDLQSVAGNTLLSLLSPLLPNRFELDQAKIGELSFEWNLGDFNRGVVHGIVAEVLREGDSWRIQGKGGQVQPIGFPVLDIDGFTAVKGPRGWQITGAKFKLGESGTISLDGEVGDTTAVNLETRDIDVYQLLPPQQAGKVSGKLDSRSTYSSDDPKQLKGTCKGRITLREARLTGLPFSEAVAQSTGIAAFEDLPLGTCEFDYSWDLTERIFRVSGTNIESPGLVRVAGEFSLDPKTDLLEGEFDLGITDRVLRRLPANKVALFKEDRDGHRWGKIPVRAQLSNSSASDEMARILVAPINGIANVFQDTLTNPLDELGNRMTEASDGGAKSVQAAADGIIGMVVGGGTKTDPAAKPAGSPVDATGAIVGNLSPLVAKPATPTTPGQQPGQGTPPGTPGTQPGTPTTMQPPPIPPRPGTTLKPPPLPPRPGTGTQR